MNIVITHHAKTFGYLSRILVNNIVTLINRLKYDYINLI